MNIKLHAICTVLVMSIMMVPYGVSAQASRIDYIRQDGRQFIQIDKSVRNFKFVNKLGEGSEFGGLIDKCDAAGVKCVDLSGYVFSEPENNQISWSVHGLTFTVVGHAKFGNDDVLLIEVGAKGDHFMDYSFSRERGVVSISLQEEGMPKELAKTFFLIGNQGLLAPSKR